MSLPLKPTHVILDRDGVINHDSDAYIKSPAEWVPIEGSLEAIARLTQAGVKVYVATNQSGVGRGYYDEATLAAIHAKMHATVEAAGGKIIKVMYCPHLPSTACICRKPLPGMLHALRDTEGVPLVGTPFIGDSFTDIQAGWAAGCVPMLLKSGYGLKTIANHGKELDRVAIFENLLEATEYMLNGLDRDSSSILEADRAILNKD